MARGPLSTNGDPHPKKPASVAYRGAELKCAVETRVEPSTDGALGPTHSVTHSRTPVAHSENDTAPGRGRAGWGTSGGAIRSRPL
jgi:hypothetical protein